MVVLNLQFVSPRRTASTTETETMTDSNFAFPIPQAVLEPYIKQAVSTAITAALGDGTELVAKAVHAALGQKVNDRGHVSQYNSDNKHNFVDVVAADAMREIARQTIHEMAEEMRPDIRKQIELQLRKSHGKLANALVDGMIKSLATTWCVQVDFKY